MRNVLKNVGIAVSAAAVSLGLGWAQSVSLASGSDPVSNPQEIVPSLHAEALVPVLQEMGISFQGATLPSGQKVILAQAPTGIKFQLTPTACSDAGDRCKGLSMVSLFESNEASERAVSAFDQHYVFVSAGMNDSGVAYLTRYDIADYGTPRGNLAISIKNYLHMAEMFQRQLYETTNLVNFAPSDSDLQSNNLNLQAILANASLADSLGISRDSHQVSFEGLPDVVSTFVEADALSPGRLINSLEQPVVID